MECPAIDFTGLHLTSSPSCPAWKDHAVPKSIQDALASDGFQKLITPGTIEFDTSVYSFREDLLSALMRTSENTSASSGSDRPIERIEKKKRDRDIESAFQSRLSALPFEKIHLAVNPDFSPGDDIHIPRSQP